MRWLLPGCVQCRRWFQISNVDLFLVGFLTLVLPLIALLVIDLYVSGEVLTYLCIGTCVLWAILYLARIWYGRKFRVVYFSPNEVMYACAREPYAAAITAQSGIPYEYRRFVARWS